MKKGPSGHDGGRTDLLRAAIECAIVAGGALLFLFWMIPNFIGEGSNLGLAPAMLPTVCAVAICGLAVVQFLSSVLGITKATVERPTGRPGLVIALLAMTIAAAFLIDRAGFGLAGAVAVGAASFCLGQRKAINLATMCAAGAGIMLLVEWSGL